MEANLIDFRPYLIANGYSTLIYLGIIKQISPQIPELTEENIRNFIVEKKKQGLSHSSLNMYIRAIKVYLRFLKKRKKITPKYFKVSHKLPKFITLEFLEKEIISNLSLMFPKYRELKVKTLLYFMFYSGLRKSEVEILKREDFNFRERQVKVYIPKTKEERLIPLNDRMINLLKEYFKSEPEKNNAFNLNKGSINHIFVVLKSNFKGTKLHPHIFRHSFAMHLQRNGFTTREIQAMLGHKSILTTMRYETADINLIKDKFNKNVK